jgi:hypothetical protein
VPKAAIARIIRFYSITSSARPDNVIGNVKPSVFAVLRLITNAYSAGCGSGLVTGGAFCGDLLGGGGLTGSAVGDTGSSRGMTVYLLTGSPICPTADLPLVDGQEKFCARKVTSVNSVAAGVANSPQPLFNASRQ